MSTSLPDEDVKAKINNVETEIKEVKEKINKVEEEIKEVKESIKATTSDKEKELLGNRLLQLGDEKNKLLDILAALAQPPQGEPQIPRSDHAIPGSPQQVQLLRGNSSTTRRPNPSAPLTDLITRGAEDVQINTPAPRRAKWSDEEDIKLFSPHVFKEKASMSWRQIAEVYFPHRTGDAVRSRYARSTQRVQLLITAYCDTKDSILIMASENGSANLPVYSLSALCQLFDTEAHVDTVDEFERVLYKDVTLKGKLVNVPGSAFVLVHHIKACPPQALQGCRWHQLQTRDLAAYVGDTWSYVGEQYFDALLCHECKLGEDACLFASQEIAASMLEGKCRVHAPETCLETYRLISPIVTFDESLNAELAFPVRLRLPIKASIFDTEHIIFLWGHDTNDSSRLEEVSCGTISVAEGFAELVLYHFCSYVVACRTPELSETQKLHLQHFPGRPPRTAERHILAVIHNESDCRLIVALGFQDTTLESTSGNECNCCSIGATCVKIGSICKKSTGQKTSRAKQLSPSYEVDPREKLLLCPQFPERVTDVQKADSLIGSVCYTVFFELEKNDWRLYRDRNRSFSSGHLQFNVEQKYTTADRQRVLPDDPVPHDTAADGNAANGSCVTQ